MFNKVVLMGNLTRDIEIRHTSSGLSIGNTAIATSRKFKSQTGEQKEEVCFIDITFFGRTAEVAQQYLHKGSKVLVEGRLKLDQWTDQSGMKRSKHSVTVDNMQMLDNRQERESLDNSAHTAQGVQNTTTGGIKPVSETIPEQPIVDVSVKDEEIPF